MFARIDFRILTRQNLMLECGYEVIFTKNSTDSKDFLFAGCVILQKHTAPQELRCIIQYRRTCYELCFSELCTLFIVARTYTSCVTRVCGFYLVYSENCY